MKLSHEWLDAPGVRDPVLSRTWARLSVEIDGAPATQLVDTRSDATRNAIYGTVFPLARWLVENWCFLLYEPPCASLPDRGRALTGAKQHPWAHRHSLLTARDGGSLPDLLIFGDESEVEFRWYPDNVEDLGGRPVRFVGLGSARVDVQRVRGAFSEFVEAVARRTEDLHNDEVDRFRDAWEDLKRAEHESPDECRWAAQLGLDWADSEEYPDELIEAIRQALDTIDASIREDLLRAASPASLQADASWLASAAEVVSKHRTRRPVIVPQLGQPKESEAHRFGYAYASRLREALGLGRKPIGEFGDVFDRLGWNNTVTETLPGASKRLDSLSGPGPGSSPVIVTRPMPSNQRRFHFARNVFHWLVVPDKSSLGLMTRAHSWRQRASRAFAAELLVPSTDLATRVTEDAVSMDEVTELAEYYSVSDMVVLWQLENHKISQLLVE